MPIFKPPVYSSFDVVRIFKKFSGFEGKVGHGGTLDPFASGVLILLLGDATKQFDTIQTKQKKYRAGIRLWASSSTLDTEGDIKNYDIKDINKLDLLKAKENFIGSINQSIPAYSAAKLNGKPFYKLAQEGINVEREKMVNIYSIDIVAIKNPLVLVDVACSSGTYIRQLTYDFTKSIGIESYLFSLERISIGDIDISKCCQLESIKNGDWKKYVLNESMIGSI